ncbi:MAG: response regulator [Chrysiogenales bacterium]|nr:MAG: response regulator [Chrysiogenales bacterium]
MASVLIVDDSKFMRKILRESLESGVHTVLDEAENGSDGIDKFLSLKPDFVTMDITMGGLDGMKAVKAIYKHDPNARVLIVSALNEHTIKMNDAEVKASAYITKPFDRDQLLEMVAGVLE